MLKNLHSISFVSFFISFFFILITLEYSFAEGTKQLTPSSADRIFLYTNGSPYNDFGRYNGEDDQRLYFHIEDPSTEQVYLGFSRPASSGHYPCNASPLVDAYFRIKDPTGRVVYPVLDSPNGQILDVLTSNITSYSQAVAGPQPIVGATGYAPFTFDPIGLPSGDYYIEFSRSPNTASLNAPVAIEWFDITVADKTANPTAINGRIFARNWALFAPSLSCGTNPTYSWFDRPFNGRFFVYTDENIVTEVNFNGAGFQPAAFNVVFNESGTTMTNDVLKDRKSIEDARSSAAQHRIFLNDPDSTVYPSGVLGKFGITPKILTCGNGAAGCIELEVTEPGQIDVIIDLDQASGEFIYDIGSADVLIAFQVHPEPGETSPYRRCIPWDGKDGFGQSLQSADDLENAKMLVRYTQGIYHFPIYDAEFMLTGFDVTTIRPIPDNGSPKKVYYDDLGISNDYGPGITQEKENPFNGCAIPCHAWTSQSFGDLNTINTWFFAREEYELQIESGGCPFAAFDDVVIMPVNTDSVIDILANDFGLMNVDTSSIKIGIPPINGLSNYDTADMNTLYEPNPSYIGLDSFSYLFCYIVPPPGNLCDSATVFITIEARPEDCQNMLDEDGDGLVDCNDPDCQAIINQSIMRKKQDNWWILWLICTFFLFSWHKKTISDIVCETI